MEERRNGKRFQISWPVKVERVEEGGESFAGAGVLRNLSSGGALLQLAEPISEGARVDLYIKLPLKKQNWMKYSCRVVRVERDGSPYLTAVKFDTARPEFGAA